MSQPKLPNQFFLELKKRFQKCKANPQLPIKSSRIKQFTVREWMRLNPKSQDFYKTIENYLIEDNVKCIRVLYHSICQQFTKKIRELNQHLEQLNFNIQTLYIAMLQILFSKMDLQTSRDFNLTTHSDYKVTIKIILEWTLQQIEQHYEITQNCHLKQLAKMIDFQLQRIEQLYSDILKRLVQNSQQQFEESCPLQQFQTQSMIKIAELSKIREARYSIQEPMFHEPISIKPFYSLQQDNRPNQNTQFDIINQALSIKLSEPQILNSLQYQFTITQRKLIEDCLQVVEEQWRNNNIYITGNTALVRKNLEELKKYQYLLKSILKKIAFTEKAFYQADQKRMLLLVSIFYLCSDIKNSLLGMRYLRKACKNISQIQQFGYPPLQKILSILENRHFRPNSLTKQLQLLYDQMPFRSPQFVQSPFSTFQKVTNFKNKKQAVGMIIPFPNKEANHIKIVRLNYCPYPTKNIIILIGGFLSQYKPKDKQWQAIIRANKYTQVYGVIWPSYCKKKFAELLKMQKEKIFEKQGLATLIDYIKPQLGLFTAIGELVRKVKSTSEDVFFDTIDKKSKISGQLLADVIIRHFYDRKVTLMGFSMGTQVIFWCLSTLYEKNGMQIVNKVVTLGGVARIDPIQTLLRLYYSSSLRWINFWSKSDLIVRWLFWMMTSCNNVIGTADIPQIPGHQIINYHLECGHMDFRQHLDFIYEKAGLKYD